LVFHIANDAENFFASYHWLAEEVNRGYRASDNGGGSGTRTST
jgi:hypothetical protein